MPTKPKRELSVSPGHDNHEVGSCCACLNLCDEHGHFDRKEVWLLRFAGSSTRLCDECLDDMEHQIHLQKARRKAGKKQT